MILMHKITLQELAEAGKNFKRENHFCEDCKRNMWGHGFVLRYFAESSCDIYLKRYRCPKCSTVVTKRPEGYWRFIRSSIHNIYQALKSKLRGLWPEGFSRQRGGHWLRRFVRHSQMERQNNLSEFLERSQELGVFFFSPS